MNDAPVDDLLVYLVLFVTILLVGSLLLWGLRVALLRWGPDESEPSPEDAARSAADQLRNAGVDVSGLLGEWSPVDRPR